MPSAAQARAFSAVMVPGAASMVASRHGRPGMSVEERSQFVGVESAGSAAAQVDGFGLPLPGVGADFGVERGEIARFEVARKDARREIAVGALLRAEGIREVDSGHSLDCSERF